MEVIYLITIILAVALQNAVRKPYTVKTAGMGSVFYSGISALSAMIFFVITSGKLEWNPAFIPYSLGFGVSFAACHCATVLATANGSLSLTSLFISYSLLLPTAYGLFFLNEPLGKGLPYGLVLLAVSLFLINKKENTKNNENKSKITLKWIIYVLISFAGNGMCSIVQKAQQTAFDGNYKNEFMIVALGLAVVILAVICIATERDNIRFYAHSGWHLAAICGLLVGLVNLFVMLLSGRMAASLMFPMISAGGIIITYAFSRWVYKEELTKAQFWGMVMGTASIVFLNI